MAWSVSEIVSRLLVLFQLVLQQVQYISLLDQLDVPWPDGFRSSYRNMEVINLNLHQFTSSFTIPVISYRGLFTIVSVMLPIVITLAILVIFQPFLFVILYAVLTFGSVVLVAGLIGKYLDSVSLDVSANTSDSYIVAGGVMTGAAFFFMLLAKLSQRQFGPRNTLSGTAEGLQADRLRVRLEAESLKRFHRLRTFRHILSTSFLVLIGLTLTGLLNFGIDSVLQSTNINIWVYIGYVFLVLGIINGIYLISCLTFPGRIAQLRFVGFIKTNGLMILFVSIGSTFIPVLTYALQIMMCKTYTCNSGTAFNPYAFRPVGSWSTSQSLYCDSCVFLNNKTCPASGTVYKGVDLCPGFDSRRSWLVPDTPCDDQASGMFRFAAVVAIAAYGISIPSVFYVVIRYLTVKVNEVSYPGENGEDLETQWSKRITMVRPVAGSLYDAFQFHSRFFVLATIGQRVLIMVILVVIAPYSQSATALMFAVYFLYCLWVCIMRPYLHGLEKGLSTGLALANVFNGAVALYVWQQGGGTGTTLFGIFVAFNVVVPLIASAIGYRICPSLPTAADAQLPKIVEQHNQQNEEVWNRKTGEIHLSRFFMVMGVFFVIAFGACVVGMLQTPTTPWVVSTSPLYQTNAQVLAGYSTWESMTDNCCCVQTANPSEEFSVGERWLCLNGKVIERGRTNRDGDTSIPLRAICGTKPTNSRCSIVTGSDGVPYMSCPDSVYDTYVPSQVSVYAYQFYW